MAYLSERERRLLPDSAFAYVDSSGQRKLPIHDEAHVRNALARFEHVAFEDDASRERARQRLLRAAKAHGIVPIGFIGGQLARERDRGTRGAPLPRGVVTFLFTDIEGSTRLVHRLGRDYAKVLRRVRRIIRVAVGHSGGLEVDCRADEFFGVFRDARAALEAAREIQHRLAATEWPQRARVRVRAGIHTGRPTVSEAGYVGVAVHTAARVCGAADGGDIVVSAAAREAIGAAARLRALGARRLPGIPDRVQLYRADVGAERAERSRAARRD